MFEHKNLDGKWSRVVPATEGFTCAELLEIRETVGTEPEKISRKQYAVVGERLVERCLPPESIGDTWAHDGGKSPWWGTVNNPPHVGLIADFNSQFGGKQYIPLDINHNVTGFACEGEEIILSNGIYAVKRKSDDNEMSAPSMRELREQYFA
ncbi:MAG: hypothetical protein ACU836_00085 [Gammaproteobacteria bacterium]